MNISPAVILGIQTSLANGNRTSAWDTVFPLLPKDAPVTRLLDKHRKALRLFQRLLERRGTRSSVLPLLASRTPTTGPPRAPSVRICPLCKVPRKACLFDKPARKRHMWLLNQQRVGRNSWRGYTPEMRARRTLAARVARWKHKDIAAIAQVAPRLTRLLGTRTILARARSHQP